MAGPYALAEANPEMQPLPDLDALIQRAIQSRPEIASLQAQIKSAEAGLSSTKRSALPSLSASGSYAKSGEDMPLEDDRWQVSVNLNWPLFTGFRQSGQVAESLSSVEQLKATLANRTLIVTEEVTSAFLGVQSSSEAVKTSQVALQQAKENLSMAQGRYQTGVSDGVELNNAQVLYTESRSSQVQAVYDQYKALAALEFAVGGIH